MDFKDYSKACQHIRDFVAYCQEHRIEIEACGCCSSPWVTCKVCDIVIEEMAITESA